MSESVTQTRRVVFALWDTSPGSHRHSRIWLRGLTLELRVGLPRRGGK